jgi:hypothetical protein
MLTRSSNVEDDAKTRQFLGHGRESTLTVSADLDTIEISAASCIDEGSNTSSNLLQPLGARTSQSGFEEDSQRSCESPEQIIFEPSTEDPMDAARRD